VVSFDCLSLVSFECLSRNVQKTSQTQVPNTKAAETIFRMPDPNKMALAPVCQQRDVDSLSKCREAQESLCTHALKARGESSPVLVCGHPGRLSPPPLSNELRPGSKKLLDSIRDISWVSLWLPIAREVVQEKYASVDSIVESVGVRISLSAFGVCIGVDHKHLEIQPRKGEP
jgi:hypothetical protein